MSDESNKSIAAAEKALIKAYIRQCVDGPGGFLALMQEAINLLTGLSAFLRMSPYHGAFLTVGKAQIELCRTMKELIESGHKEFRGVTLINLVSGEPMKDDFCHEELMAEDRARIEEIEAKCMVELNTQLETILGGAPWTTSP